MKIILLLGRRRGGGTEAHANWLLGALRSEGMEVELYSLFPEHYKSSRTEAFYEAFILRYACSQFIKWAKKRQVGLVICFGRLANCCGHEIKRQIPDIYMVATCRTNRRFPSRYRKTLITADLVFTNSRWASQRVSTIRGVLPARIRTLPNALLRSELSHLVHTDATREQARTSFGLKPSRPVICMLAHFVPGKNQECLIRLLAERSLPNGTQLLMVGGGPRLHFCKRLVRKLAKEEDVRFTGKLENISEAFHASDLIVSTSLRDSMPNALVEAQAAGLPVIAYNVAGVGETFLHEQSGLLVPRGDARAMADAVCRLIESMEERINYSQIARKQALASFNPDLALSEYRKQIEFLFGH